MAPTGGVGGDTATWRTGAPYANIHDGRPAAGARGGRRGRRLVLTMRAHVTDIPARPRAPRHGGPARSRADCSPCWGRDLRHVLPCAPPSTWTRSRAAPFSTQASLEAYACLGSFSNRREQAVP
ncbi:Protein of unknown function [Gryllus bimaculatus]|nr:Protein of unknown function [Gryllus bimaculatus]